MPDAHPTCRAAIRDGRLTLNRWTPRLLGGLGPEPAGFRTIDVALADLRMLDDEVVVTPVPRAPWSEAAEDIILVWAALVGYRRAWLPSRVVAFDDLLAPIVTAAADCPTCGAHWADASVDFWHRVRRDGWFPPTCLACGGSLPEWTPGPADGWPGSGGAKVSDRADAQRHTQRGEARG